MRLTKRQSQIVALAALGLKNKEIAQRLSITERTVKNHLRTVFFRLGVSRRSELKNHPALQRNAG